MAMATENKGNNSRTYESAEIVHVSKLPPVMVGNIKEQPLTQPNYVALKGYVRKYRDLLLLKCLRGTGLRIAEVLRWAPEHLQDDGVNLSVLVIRGKRRLKTGSVPQWEGVPLQGELSVEVRHYVQGNGIAPGEPIFQVSARQFRNVLAQAGRLAIGRPVHPHELRHLYIKGLIDDKVPVERVSALVGHADVKTTLKHYYDLDWAERRQLNDRVPV